MDPAAKPDAGADSARIVVTITRAGKGSACRTAP